MTKSSRACKFIKALDIFGFPIGVNYKGEGSYNTLLGAFCTTSVYALILFNFVALVTSLFDGSNQQDNSNFNLNSRAGSDQYNIADNHL